MRGSEVLLNKLSFEHHTIGFHLLIWKLHGTTDIVKVTPIEEGLRNE